jgi:hypothetical protein
MKLIVAKRKYQEDAYFQGVIEFCTLKRLCQRKGEPKSRVSRVSYFGGVCGKGTSVCKKAFTALHGVTEM